MSESNTEISPTNSTHIRTMVLAYYEDCIIASSALQTWMLSRRGSFRSAYIPFFQSFVKLYQTTRSLNTLNIDTTAPLKRDIEKWISGNVGIRTMTPREQLNFTKRGLFLFEMWGKLLYDQTIIEFR